MSDIELEVISRWREGQSQRTIARELRIGRNRIRRIVKKHLEQREQGAPHPELPTPSHSCGSQLDRFQEQIDSLLSRYPNITAQRVFEELQDAGYQGGYTIVRERIRQQRPRPPKAPVVRFETSPGRQAQMDYAVYELDFASEGRRRVNLFSYILGYSRRQYLHFTESQDFETTIRQHVCAFEHLRGVAATCLYDNMKVVVQRWQDERPIYNTRFLAFATHYGFRPAACRPRRPQTKGKVERPFAYVESNLLNGRTFRSLEHLNEVTRWWLANVADVREHRGIKKKPIDAHAEELAHLLPLPAHHYDTAKVLYRLVSPEGYISYLQNHYSVPWQRADELLPVRVTEQRLLVYDQHLNLVADHLLFSANVQGEQRTEQDHRPPRNQRVRLEWLQDRFAEWGDVGNRFLEGLLRRQRYNRQQAQGILRLQRYYRQQDLIAALERAVRYHAYSLEAVERILASQATPCAAWKQLSDDQQDLLQQLSAEPPTAPRPTSDYQHLLFDAESEHVLPEDAVQPPDLDPPANPRPSSDVEDSADE